MAIARLKSLARRLLPRPSLLPPVSPRYQGVIRELSTYHIEGWILDTLDPAARVDYEVVLADTGTVLASGWADQFRHGLHAAGAGDGAHGFIARLPENLDAATRTRISVRPARSAEILPRSPHLATEFEPLLHIAMDIVDNCNLRCPFCLYDYANTHTTHVMDDATFEAALRFLPYTRDGEFWLSCLHEPTLHPKLQAFIEMVPRPYRRKLGFTTNLAKRMPATYYALLADAGVHHINVSIESLQPELYERMRRGARHRIFLESWNALLAAMDASPAPPHLNYVVMAYKSNLAELPDLVGYLLNERRAAMVQLRYTFDIPHISREFCASEFLTYEEWLTLRDRLSHYPPDRVQLLLPPAPRPAQQSQPQPVPLSGQTLQDYYMFRLSWDGSLRAVGILQESRGDNAIESQIAETNLRDVGDPLVFLDTLARHTK